MGEADIDITVAGLERLVEVIRAQWVGAYPDREDGPRAGTLFISPDRRTVRLELRFPLAIEELERLLGSHNI
jgi:hypothetical protein